MSLIDEQHAIGPETLPIVQELREELERMQAVCKNWETQWNGEYQMRRSMKKKLTEYEPVLHAHWNKSEGGEVYGCSNCGGESDNRYIRCHYCGAHMDEEVSPNE